MLRLQNKRIILGITGSIAAYKTPQLVRLLVKESAHLQVVMTSAAEQFVTPLSLATVSGNPVLNTISSNGQWNNHVLMARDADLMLIAPCSANTLGKLANGICDNMLNAVYLSASCPILIAPAMDEDMWLHPSTKANIQKLQSYGNSFIPVGSGALASGLVGAGRMAEPEEILEYAVQALIGLPAGHQPKAMVSAGPTYEAIDPVRFIGNHSTGKMGTALALALAKRGYHVYFIAGPGVSAPLHPSIETISVTSALDMYTACHKYFAATDITIMAAAVADYRPEHPANQKIKKDKDNQSLSLTLVQNPDILAGLGIIKKAKQILVGFALETNNEEENALKKLKAKKADYIVLNSMNDKGAGFGSDTNKVTILSQSGEKYPLPLQSKEDTAEAIISKILS